MDDYFSYPLEDLEIRQSGRNRRTLSGIFRYGKTAVRSDRGRVRKERIGPNAFDYSVKKWAEIQKKFSDIIDEGLSQIAAERDRIEQELDRAAIHLLQGHSFDRPIADTKTGNLRVSSNRLAFEFEADLPSEERNTPSYMNDLLLQIEGKIITPSLSPGFRVPPSNAVANAQEIVKDPGETVLTRVINQAVLKEMSIVTSPNYAGTEVELRHDEVQEPDNLNRKYFIWL